VTCETLRKYISMLKAVTRECRNTVVDEMLAKGKIVVGKDNKEPFSLDKSEVETLLASSEAVGGWRGAVCSFSIAMMTFLMLRPGELMRAFVDDIDLKKWTFLVSSPKGKNRYGEVVRLPIPDLLRPFVLRYLEEREQMLRSKGIEAARALIPSVVGSGAAFYTQQGFGRLKSTVAKRAGLTFKWKDFRPSGGQIALDAGVPIELVSRSMRHASTLTTERYYCRAKADLAFARVNDAFNTVFGREPAIAEKND